MRASRRYKVVIRSWCLFLIGFLIGAAVGPVQAATPERVSLNIASGATLLEFCGSGEKFQQSACLGYVAGISDAMIERKIAGEAAPIRACIAPSETVGTRAAHVMKWLARHDNRLLEPAAGLTAEALRDAYPCPK